MTKEELACTWGRGIVLAHLAHHALFPLVRGDFVFAAALAHSGADYYGTPQFFAVFDPYCLFLFIHLT